VWESSTIDFLIQQLPADFLITTRHSTIAHHHDPHPIDIEQMLAEEAVEIIWGYCNNLRNPLAEQQPEIRKLAKCLGYWPLLLHIHGHWLRREVEEGRSLSQAIAWVNRGLAEEALLAFDHNTTFAATMALSWDGYTKLQRQCLFGLLAFREQEAIPEDVIVRLWSATAGTGTFAAEKLIRELAGCFYQRSKEKNGDRHVIHMHDLIREYLTHQWEQADLKILHCKLLDAYNENHISWHEVDDDGYLYDHLVYHLQQAKRHKEIFSLFGSEGWTRKRHIQGLLSDFGTAHDLSTISPNNNLANSIPFALYNTVIRSFYHNVPVSALSSVVDNKLVSPSQLISAIYSMQGAPVEKLQIYFGLLRQIPEHLQKQFALKVYPIAKTIREPDERATSINRLMPHLPDQVRIEATRVLWQTLFEIEDLKTRSALLEELCHHVLPKLPHQPSQQLHLLLEDAMKIEKIYRKISILKVVLPYFPIEIKEQNWEATYKGAIDNCHNKHTKVERLSTLVPLLPKNVRQKINKDIWPALNAIENWEVIYGEFSKLLPYIPAEQLPEIWSRVKDEVNFDTLDYYRKMNYLSFMVGHLPENLLADFQRLVQKHEFKNRYQAVWEIELAKRLPGLTDSQRTERYLKAGKMAIIGEGDMTVQDIVQRLPIALTPQIWGYAINEFCSNWNSKDGREQGWLSRRIDETLIALAKQLPEQQIDQACSDCVDKLEWFNYPRLCVELLAILINRIRDTEKHSSYKSILDRILAKADNEYSSQISFAYTLMEALPHLQYDEYLPKLLHAIDELQDKSLQASHLIGCLPLYTIEARVELWCKAWCIAVKLNEKTDHFLAMFQLLKALPSICSQQKLRAQIDFEKLTQNPEALDYVISNAQAEGLASLIILAPQHFAHRVWNTIDDRKDRIEYVWLALFPHLALEHQESLLPQIMCQSCTSEKVATMQQIGLFSHWSGQHLLQAWQRVSTGINTYNDATYTTWAWLFLKQIPQSHLYPAWQLALKNISPTYWFEWPEICEDIARRLPQNKVRQAWLDIEGIEQKQEHFRYAYQLSSTLYIFLLECNTSTGVYSWPIQTSAFAAHV